jgi:hypothetical protein
MTLERRSDDVPRIWRNVLVHEMFEYFFNFAFLALFLVAFAWYRRLILASYHIRDLGYWMPVVEAAVLAKIIMIGDALRIGHRLRNKPLAIVTLYRTIAFSLLVVIFTLLEHVVGALLHGKAAADGIAEIREKGLDEILAGCVLILAAFIPFFAMKEIERAFGAEKVRGLFFRRPAESSKPK